MKIAFTSCINLDSDSERHQAVWGRIAAEQPDYLFLTGDQIYMDYFPHLGEPEGWGLARFTSEMRARYERQWAVPEFRQLIDGLRSRQGAGGGVYGTWDDHDFAWNNACGSEVPADKKAAARALFTEYMQVTPAPGAAGIYYSTPLLHEGTAVGKAIFLDTRWYREPAADAAVLLGDAQFAFLQQELAGYDGFVVLCAGTPMRATGNGWVPYKQEYRRFLDLIGSRPMLFLSGDIHENAFLPPGGGSRLFEVIASGAFVKKYKFIGRRENFGILDYTPQASTITLFDRRGSTKYRIDHAGFDYSELA